MSLPQKTVVAGLGTLGTFEGSVARFLARKLRRISNELTSYEPEGREFESFRASPLSSYLTTVYAATPTARGSGVLGILGRKEGSGISKPSPILAATS